MSKQYKIVEGNYKNEDDVVIQIDTTETVTNVVSSNFNVGNIRKQIENINTQIESLKIEKEKLKELLDSTKDLMKEAVTITNTNE